MDNNKFKLFLAIIGLILLVVVIVALIVIEIYAWVTYGGEPLDQIPIWALWFMFGK